MDQTVGASNILGAIGKESMPYVGPVLLVCSFLGYVTWLTRVRRLHPAWAPGIVFAGASVTLMVAGMVGLLEGGTWLVLLGGLALGCLEVLRHRTSLLRTLSSPAILLLALVGVALVIALQGVVMTHYDNFSHWGLIVQVMLDGRGFPTEDNPLVLFTTYPLGASVLGYLAGRLVAPTDLPMLIVQNLWIATGALPLVALAGRAWRWAILPTIASVVLLMFYITTPNGLLVDPLVASQVAWGALCVFYHRDRLAGRLPELSLVMTSLVAVKTSGAFFAVVIAIVAIVVARGQKPAGARVWLLGPLLMVVAWQVHVSLSFSDPAKAKHSVSLSRYTDVFGDKSGSQVRQIVGSLASFVLTNWFLWLSLGVLVVAAVALVRHGVLQRRAGLFVVVSVLAVTGLWVLSLLATYLLSMPTEEAMRLAGSARYMSTWHLVVAVSAVGLCLSMLAAPDRRSGAAALVLGTALPVALAASAMSAAVRPSITGIPTEEYRTKIEAGLADLTIEPEDTLCVATAGEERGITRHLVRYLSVHPHVRAGVIPVEDPPAWFTDCTDAIVLTEQPAVQSAFEDMDIPVVVVP